ncbi:PREDICTED: xanthine dehydrogenase/oxidase-like [Cyphomyrmex costatus]|uniref:xanthine dehydrogenase/oxidase-like n=1 Tax=Cyphomyrmex costatus TaxID=456900 RepID=UPI00085228D3|nr:PREDICTED: xanthine dehydrogenase/oxidase-like [Cyphomyrmex costatus]
MCYEGDCGACIVHVKFKNKNIAVNSCLVPVLICDGWDIYTIESVGNKRIGYHKIQAELALMNGSQCGYCSPGMVMNLYSLGLEKAMSMEQIENSFGGNICRCTGYRAILKAFKKFAFDGESMESKAVHDIEELHKIRVFHPRQNLYPRLYPHKMPCVRTYYDKQHSDGITMLSIKLEDAYFYKVTTVEALFELLKNNAQATYILNGGNTAYGIYRSSKKNMYIDINNIPDMSNITKTDSTLVLGGNVTLTMALEAFLKYSTETGFKYLSQLAENIEMIANVPVRNIGTVAGNLMLKYEHREFPSDLFLILQTLGTLVHILESPSQKESLYLWQFLKLDMHHKIIYSVVLPKLTDQHIYRFYKVMPRAQNARAHVNTGFLFKIDTDGNVLEIPDIIFGGINKNFYHASGTEILSMGKNLFDQKDLKSLLQMLSEDLQPDHTLSNYSPEFRKTLAIGLFYKFMLSIKPEVNHFYRGGGTFLKRSLSSGQQKFDENFDEWPVSKPMPKLEAYEQAAGEVRYCNDLGPYHGEVFCAFVVTKICKGKIKSIDASEVRKMKGVIAFFSADDVPGENLCISAASKLTSLPEDELLFAKENVLYAGQPVGVIVAETHNLANEAADLVQITYSEDVKNPIISIEYAINANDKTRIRESVNIPAKRKGTDIEYVIKGGFKCGSQYHYTLETQSCVCVPVEGNMNVYPSSQWMDLIQVSIANCLNVRSNSINVHVNRLGGSYGSKISRNAQISCACALVCHKLNRPARFITTIESNMQSIGKRCSTRQEYEIGVNNNGVIQYLDSRHWSNCGSSFNESQAAMVASYMQRSCYITDTWTFIGFDVRTDLPSNTFCRASGSTEGMAIIENMMEHIAKVTRFDSVQVRLANMNDVDKSVLIAMMNDLSTKANYDEMMVNTQYFNSLNRWKKKGVAMVPMKYLITNDEGQYNAMVSICARDGTVCVTHSGIEIDQGIHTKIAQVAARTLKIDINTITIKTSSNLMAPNASTTGHSITTENCGYATQQACIQILKKLEPIKKKMGETTWEKLIFEAYREGIDLCEHYTLVTELTEDKKSYPVYGVTIAEIEIDVLTGQHIIRKVYLMIDSGLSLNPLIDVGQAEGAFVMGIGYWTSEDLVYDPETGILMNNKSWNYNAPGVKDIPERFHVYLRNNKADAIAIYGSKSINEAPLCMSCVIPIAIRNALDSARIDAGNYEWYQLDGPCTTERILLNTLTSLDMMVYE